MNGNLCEFASSNSVSPIYWKTGDGDEATIGIVLGSFLLLFVVLGLPWNFLVLVTIIQEKLYHQPSIILLMNLVLSDITILIYPLPIFVATGLMSEYSVGNSDQIRCQTCSYGYVVNTFLYNSLFTVALMSVDKFLYIYKPLQYDRKVTQRVVLVPVLIAWLFSIAIGIASQVIPGRTYFMPSLLGCARDTGIEFIVILLVVGFAALVVILICNIWILCIVLNKIKLIYITRRSITKENMHHQQQINKRIRRNRQRKQLNLFRTFGALILSDAITWIPYISLIIALIIKKKIKGVPSEVIAFVAILFYSQCLIHPFVQTLFIADVREPLKQLLTCGFKSGQQTCQHRKGSTCLSRDKEFCGECFFFAAMNSAVVQYNEAEVTDMKERENCIENTVGASSKQLQE